MPSRKCEVTGHDDVCALLHHVADSHIARSAIELPVKATLLKTNDTTQIEKSIIEETGRRMAKCST